MTIDDINDTLLRKQFFYECGQHIEKAKTKHPKFASRVVANIHDGADLLDIARRIKSRCEEQEAVGNASILDVLFSEVYEFLHEVQYGNIERAQDEAADVVAVLWRAIEWIKLEHK